MSNQVRVTISLQVGGFYVSQPGAFIATQAGSAGPSPGDVLATPAGVDVSFSQLSSVGGMCRLYNKDPINWVDWGIFDHTSNRFYPVGELMPGESSIIRLSRFLGEQLGTGSGSHADEATEALRLRSHGGNARVVVDAFDP